MRENRAVRAVCAALVLALLSATAGGCAAGGTGGTGGGGKVDLSECKQVVELATLECTYHNVAELVDDGTDGIFGIKIGYKKAWFEYSGTVKLGLDASRVEVGQPDADNTVTITIPKAQVIGEPNPDESSFSDVYVETSFLTTVSIEDKTAAYETAQKSMKEAVENDEALLQAAGQRAKTILESYVTRVGSLSGKTLSVKWNEAE
jgi:sorbitol-specific phosphotransferase system component IIBC